MSAQEAKPHTTKKVSSVDHLKFDMGGLVRLTCTVPREGQNSATQERTSFTLVPCRGHKSAQESTCILLLRRHRVFVNAHSDSRFHRLARPSPQPNPVNLSSLAPSSSSSLAASGASALSSSNI